MENPGIPSRPKYTHLSMTGSSSRTSSPRCTQCNAQQKKDTKNLIVCIDGTSNKFGPNSTNVSKLYEMIMVDEESTSLEQRARYFCGIGTGEEPSTPEQRPSDLSGTSTGKKSFCKLQTAVSNMADIVFARNAKTIVKEAYCWLAENYQEGDQIFLFGFSRGAYQVRVLAGMIYEVGLMKEVTTEDQLWKAYNHYEAIHGGTSMAMKTAREFKNLYSWQDLRVHFVGVWDTVSSIGPIKKDVFLSMSSSAAHACHFRHALALDERRVKFMPEYFYEVNSQTSIGKFSSTLSNISTDHSVPKKSPNIKEVWFAGSHSDVGGKSGPGKCCNAGLVPLNWMCREAAANGLLLKPTDQIWLPDDLDSGITNSMTLLWRIVEYVRMKHQTSFSGTGEDARRSHRLRARRIIPGQKIHASILYANTYQPKATLGEGFDIPIICPRLDDMDLDDQIWETGLFDNTAAESLLTSLCNRQGVAPRYLFMLLFMLRFREGRRYVREVDDWQAKFMRVIMDRTYPPLVRLVAIIACHEVSCDSNTPPKGCVSSSMELLPDILPHAKDLNDILAPHKRSNTSITMVVALLKPLTKHQILRKWILLPKIVERLVKLFDAIVKQPGDNFGQMMGCLSCMLQCEDIRQYLIEKLGATLPNSSVPRLSWILKVNDPSLLTAALRMVLTIAHIPEAKKACSAVIPRIKKLARKDERPIGHLAIEILLVLDELIDCEELNIQDTRIRVNLTSALVRLYLNRHGSAGDSGRSGKFPGQQILRNMFGIGATELTAQHKDCIGELRRAIEVRGVRECTSATITILMLCETTIIRTHLRDNKCLDVFIGQLRRKRTALLAAYVLATCLKYSDMNTIKLLKDLPKHIVGMLRLDYFDDTVGQIEGFQIFRDFMQHADLREKFKRPEVKELLIKKLGKGDPKQIRTSLICLDIFRTFDPGHLWTNVLVESGLERLKSPKRRIWEAGAKALSALVQSEHSMSVIASCIHQVIEMLLPEDYQPTPPRAAASSSMAPSAAETETESTYSYNLTSDLKPLPPIMGPAYVMCIFAQNEMLRNQIRKTNQYSDLKKLYYGSGMFVSQKAKRAWQKRDDVINMLGDMFKAVEKV